MIYKMYCVYDSKSESYGNPMFLKARGEAIRSFTDVASDGTSAIAKHPSDYTLFELGEYNASNAQFTLLPTPTSLGVAVELLPV